ncbi:hypothetical protein E5S46_01360 [Escherichia coli]|nr:hypothetical protein [Escherichia coli]TGI10256.1 hypothetical protein E5S46_01360 [Escherichia coli]
MLLPPMLWSTLQTLILLPLDMLILRSFQIFSQQLHSHLRHFVRMPQRMHFETLEMLFLQRYWRFLLLRQHWPPPHELCHQRHQSRQCYFYTTQRFRCAR